MHPYLLTRVRISRCGLRVSGDSEKCELSQLTDVRIGRKVTACAACGAALTLLVSADWAAPRLAGRLEATLVEKGP